MVDGMDCAGRDWDRAAEEPKDRRRYAVHINRDTWQLLAELSARSGLSMSSLVHFLLTERDPETLIAAARTRPGRRRGRPRKSYHT